MIQMSSQGQTWMLLPSGSRLRVCWTNSWSNSVDRFTATNTGLCTLYWMHCVKFKRHGNSEWNGFQNTCPLRCTKLHADDFFRIDIFSIPFMLCCPKSSLNDLCVAKIWCLNSWCDHSIKKLCQNLCYVNGEQFLKLMLKACNLIAFLFRVSVLTAW
jgi:hypothetical protein